MHIRRVKEFRFREILRPSHGNRAASEDAEDIDVHSIDNLVVRTVLNVTEYSHINQFSAILYSPM